MRGVRLATGLLLLSFAPALSQIALAATIAGTVTGPDRVALPGVNIGTGSVLTVATADHGKYEAPGLQAGAYLVRAEFPGFETEAREVRLSEDMVATVDFRLRVAGYQEAVQVIGAVPLGRLEVTDRTETGARDVGEALARLGGVTLLRKGGIANDILVGAYQGENLTVLIDGARLHGACPNNMDPPAAHADLSEVARIEIGKGPFDVTNQGSLGGVVNIVTARPAKGFHGQADLSAASAGFINPAFTISHGGTRASLLGGFSFRTADPYVDGAGRRLTEYANYRDAAQNSRAFDATTGWGRAYLRPRAADSVHLSYTRQHLNHVLYPYLLMDGIWDTADRASAAYERTQSAGFDTVGLTAYVSRVRHLMTDEHRITAPGSGGYSMGTSAATHTSGVRFQAVRGAATLGGEWYRRQWEATTRFARAGYAPQYALPDVVQLTGGVYAQLARDLGATRWEAGGRIDRTVGAADAETANVALYEAYHQTRSTSRANTYVSGKLRASTTLGQWHLAAGIGHSARPPDPQERYYALARQGSDWVGNPELPIVQNTGVRADAGYRGTRLVLDGAIQYDRVRNFITPYAQVRQLAIPGVANVLARSFANVDARILTLESKASYSFGSRWFGSAALFFTRGAKTPDPARRITSTNLSEIPPARAELTLRHDRGRLFGEAACTLNARQERVDRDLGERPTPANGVVALRAGVRLSHVRAALALHNLFDRWYYNHLSFQRDPFRSGVAVWEPGRTLHANLSVAW
jgi:iron complex outermembrane receptor protein